jgi:leader peptidase (prepilin peptidase)/N-methyltransferase
MSGTDVAVIVLAVIGAAVGYGADFVARRWPDHEDDYVPRRALDWRMVVVVLTGAASGAGLASRFSSDPQSFVIYAVLFVPLLVLLATDLDQRILPDLVTLPLIAFAAVILILGWSPALADKDLGRISGVVMGILAPALLLITDRLIGGDLGMGDVKLSISIGLMFGISGLIYGLLVASIGFAIVLVALMAVRKLGMKSAVPFGPVLIFAALIAALAA